MKWLWTYCVGYFLAIVVGHIIIISFLNGDYKRKGEQLGFTEDLLTKYKALPQIVGIIERFLYVTAFLAKQWAFAGVWLAFKVASRWAAARLENEVVRSDKNTTESLFRDYNAFIIGNGLSITYGVAGWKVIDWIQNDSSGLPKTSMLVLVLIASSFILRYKYINGHLKFWERLWR